jgi:hypothetical protein
LSTVIWSFIARSLRAAVDLRAIIAAYLLLGFCYSLVTPIFETPDEPQHFFVVREIVEQHGLPVQRAGEQSRWLQEGSQPPLYYLLGAVLSGWIDASDWREFASRNPFAVQGDPLTPGNRNVFLHRAAEEFPWQGTVLAVRLLRLLSLGLGAAAVAVTYALACQVFPGRRRLALGAAAIHAFIPQFTFISAAVSNDSLAALACGAVLWQSVRVARGAAARRADLVLGVLVGLAALSKLSGAALGVVALAAVAMRAASAPVSDSRLPQALFRASLVTVAALAVAGWWYVRNLIAYGDPTGLNRMLAIVGMRNPAPDLRQVLDELEGLRLSFWGIFGWFSILMPAVFYWLFDGLALAALVGLAIRLAVSARRRSRALPEASWLLHPAVLLVLTVALVFAGVIRWGILTPGLQGRLLFPALPALAVLLSAGLDSWYKFMKHPRIVWARYVLGAYPLVYLLIAAAVPFMVIAPAYARPELSSAQGAAPMLRWTGAAQIELVGSEPPFVPVHPGDELPLGFRWLTREPIGSDFTLFIKVFGEGDELLASTDTYPGFGMFPTSSWPANRVIVDRYRLRVNTAARVPVYAEVVIGFYNRATGTSLLPVNAEGGRVVRPVVMRARIVPAYAESAAPAHPLTANFGDEIMLRGYDLSAAGITLYWQALRKAGADYTVFVQALDRDGHVLAQADGRPRHGAYPTSVWEPGERVPDEHALVWPPQTARVAVGLYVLETGVRLPLSGQAGDAIMIDMPR